MSTDTTATETGNLEMTDGRDDTSSGSSGLLAKVGRALRSAWRHFRAFRATRPFWGGLWMVLAGAEIIQMTRVPMAVAIGGGWNSSAGYILGGGLLMFGLVAWFAPHYSGLVGLVGIFVALAAFVAANLGGLLIGSFRGVIGGAMTWGWGEKKPARPRGRRRRASDSAA